MTLSRAASASAKLAVMVATSAEPDESAGTQADMGDDGGEPIALLAPRLGQKKSGFNAIKHSLYLKGTIFRRILPVFWSHFRMRITILIHLKNPRTWIHTLHYSKVKLHKIFPDL